MPIAVTRGALSARALGLFGGSAPLAVTYLIVAGGGGGGPGVTGTYWGGGGGAGGYRSSTATLAPGSYTVTVGG